MSTIPRSDSAITGPVPAHWKLTLAYDGTDFHGWQVQPGLPTVQGILAAAITSVTGEQVLPQGSGRTDTGVHALGQTASFPLRAPIPAENLVRALNRMLPAAIRVLAAEPVPSSFHARHSALEKTYQYRIFSTHAGAICPPFLARFVHLCPWPLQVEAMRQAAELVLGEHDFTSFAATDPDQATRSASDNDAPASAPLHASTGQIRSGNLRTLFASGWTCEATSAGPAAETVPLLCYTVRGNGFLHHMVRNLVGTFLEVGRGRLAPAEISRILAARDRSLAGPTAPASGLFLLHVRY
jgi:tRNA pseudouridine38-40 synthase